MRSMTGFGERRFAAPGLRVKISIKSLNHRFFDWNYKGTPLGDAENRHLFPEQHACLAGIVGYNNAPGFIDNLT